MDDDDDECGAVGGMTGSRNWRTKRNHALVPLCAHKITWPGLESGLLRSEAGSFLGGGEPSPLVLRPFIGLLYQLWITDDDYDCGATGRMNDLEGNRSTWRKPAPVPLWPLHIPHNLPRSQTSAAVVGNWWLTAWAMTQPNNLNFF
jgi:hypothetical protein